MRIEIPEQMRFHVEQAMRERGERHLEWSQNIADSSVGEAFAKSGAAALAIADAIAADLLNNPAE